MSKSQLEKRYGISIVENGYYSPVTGRYVKLYDIYTADGCRWDTGFHTLKGVKEECEQWKDAIVNIKKSVQKSA